LDYQKLTILPSLEVAPTTLATSWPTAATVNFRRPAVTYLTVSTSGLLSPQQAIPAVAEFSFPLNNQLFK